jgi:hypothetical protein
MILKAFNSDGKEIPFAIDEGGFTVNIPKGYTLVKEKNNLQQVLWEKTSEKLAVAKFTVKNTVQGFELFFDETSYGHYPCDEGRFHESMQTAIGDAIQYGYNGIVFKTDWQAKGE